MTLEHIHFHNIRNEGPKDSFDVFILYYLFLSLCFIRVLFFFSFSFPFCASFSAPITVETWSVVQCSLYMLQGESPWAFNIAVSLAHTARKREN